MQQDFWDVDGHRACHGRKKDVSSKVLDEDAVVGLRGGGGRDTNVELYMDAAGVLSGTFLLCNPLELDRGNSGR
jgi:hypothetical protein